MKPLTEFDLRTALKDNPAPAYHVPRGTVVTPAAGEYLRQRRVELVYDDPASAPAPPRDPGPTAPKWDFSAPEAETAPGGKPQLFFGPDGGAFDHKPESLTHLKGRQLVRKDHPVIIWRGKLDSLAARIVEAQVCAWQSGRQDCVDDLQEILDFTRRLLACEIRGQEVEDWNLLGLSAADLRERSHDPVKFFGRRHLLVTYTLGPLAVSLNTLRTLVREAELAAAAAFKDSAGHSTRDDLIRALNRLSSLFYILMFKYLPPGLETEPSGI